VGALIVSATWLLGTAASAFTGTATPPLGGVLHVRTGPGVEYPIAYSVLAGQPLDIECYKLGSPFAGTNIWFLLSDGNYVTGSGVSLGSLPPACGWGREG
jgi:uncharacterized protein YraI